MSYEDDKTKVIGRREMAGEYEEYTKEYSEFNHAYEEESGPEPEVDELAFLDEEQAAAGSRQHRGQTPGAGTEAVSGEEQQRGAAAPKPKKRSKKGLLIALIILFLLACGGGAFALLQANQYDALELDLMEAMSEPDVSGYEGEGVLDELIVRQDAVDEIIRGLDKDEQKSAVSDFFDSVQYKASKSTSLSEGDTISITASYNKSLAEAAEITVTGAETTYTVGALQQKVEETKEEPEETSVNMPQWYRFMHEEEGELAVTCLLLAEKGTSVTLPIEFMYCYPGGPMSEMVDTSEEPNLTYQGQGYYLEDGAEAPVGSVTEVDESHIKYSVKQYGDKFTIKVTYTANDDGSINVTSASGGETQIPTGTYQPISSGEAASLGGGN